jgi:hypothetical protein
MELEKGVKRERLPETRESKKKVYLKKFISDPEKNDKKYKIQFSFIEKSFGKKFGKKGSRRKKIFIIFGMR